jgi:hypothetical protein
MFRRKQLAWTTCLLMLALLCGRMPLLADDLQFADGNGNLYRVTEKAGRLLEYLPVSPVESSSGQYSGGDTRSARISEADYQQILVLFKKAEDSKESYAAQRKKGTFILTWTEGARRKEILLKAESAEADSIEEYLRRCLRQPAIPVTYEITRSEDPWHGMTGSAEEEERTRHIRARSFPLAGFSGISNAPALLWKGQPILYKSNHEVAVDDRFFSDLERPDATRLQPGESKRMGTAVLPELLPPQFLLPFLLYSQLIVTYWHTDAQLRFVKAERRDRLQCYSFDGVHHYYTNKKNTHGIRFAICVNPETREIFVVGE